MLMRSQGRTSWRRFNEATAAGRVPAREVLDGALVIFGGALLLTPGFITDILGLILLIPPTRALVRAVLVRRLAHRMVVSVTARPPARRATAAARRLRRRGLGGRPRPDAAEGPPLTDARLEAAQRPTGPAFADAVTFSFADPAAGLYGLARLGLAGADGSREGSALAVLFAGREPVAALAEGGVRLDGESGFERLELPGLEATVDEPLSRWTLRFDGGERATR